MKELMGVFGGIIVFFANQQNGLNQNLNIILNYSLPTYLKEDLAKIYHISKDDYNRLEPYIIIPDKRETKKIDKEEKEPVELFTFNPNTLETEGWRKLGLSERQAKTIMNYRSKGGRFYKKEDLKKIYIKSKSQVKAYSYT